MMNLSKNVKVTKVKAGQTAATTTITSDEIDMKGFEGVIFVGSIATANAGNYAKIQQDSATGLASAADLEGSKNTPGDDGDSFFIDIYRPQERFLQCVVTRGVSTAVGDIYAIQYGARSMPTSQGDTIDAELHVSPDEGTA